MTTPTSLPLSCYRLPPRQRLIAKEGYRFLLIGILGALAGGFFWGFWGALPFSIVTLYIASFFRNPHRQIPQAEGLILSPADGRILEIVECEESNYLKAKAMRVSIFMSPLNCHINRAPVAGNIVDCFYKPGSFAAAFKPKAMTHNEHNAVLMEDAGGDRWLVVQIAGWLARRIVSYVKGGEELQSGERFGLIQFGSRVDLYCPLHAKILVRAGDKVYAGKTILGMGKI